MDRQRGSEVWTTMLDLRRSAAFDASPLSPPGCKTGYSKKRTVGTPGFFESLVVHQLLGMG